MPIWDPQANELFSQALDCATLAERQAMLDVACRNNPLLRERVEQLLSAHDQAGSLLERPAWDTVSAGLGTTPPDGSKLAAGRSKSEMPPAIPSLDFLAPAEAAGLLGRLEPYDILEILGYGGMGIVLKARDPLLNRIVAIKVLAPTLATNATARQRFVREAQAAAAVRHDHIVTIYGVGEASSLPYLVMEYVAGESLQQIIDCRGTLGVEEIVDIGAQMATGLAAAHRQGLIHRDIKPANILIDHETKRAKITDFGLARAVDDVGMTQEGVVAGTPQYMAPEQARGESVDQRADLFSLGSVLYAMCTGRAPFQASSTVGMLRKVCDDRPKPIGELNPQIPGWLVAIIERLHAKAPAERIQSAAELVDLLNRSPHGFPAPAANSRRFRPATVAAVLLVVGSIVALEATGVTGFATTIVEVARGDGTLVIETDDPGVKVQVNGENVIIRGAGSSEIRVAPGAHRVTFLQDGKRIDEQIVTISRRGRVVARISHDSSRLATAASGPATYDELLKQANLRMSFDEQSFYKKDGLSYVRDLSGHGNDGQCVNVNFTPNGRHGGGLENSGAGYVRIEKSLITGQPEFTIAAWVNSNGSTGPQEIYGVKGRQFPAKDEPRFHLRMGGNAEARHIFTAAWNGPSANTWIGVTSAPGLVRADQWTFVAVTFQVGGTSQGQLGMYVGNRVMKRAFQMIGGEKFDVVDLIGRNLIGTIDELMVWQRALSDEELIVIYRRISNDRQPRTLVPTPSIGSWPASPKEVERKDVIDGSPSETDRPELALAQRGQWREALQAFEKRSTITPNNYVTWIRLASLQLYLGEVEAYRRTSRELLARFSKTTDVMTAERIARICALAPNWDGDFSVVEALMDRTPESGWRIWDLLAKGLVEYRAGRADSALPWLNRAAARSGGGRGEPTVTATHAIVLAALALVKHELDDVEGARMSLESARSQIATKLPDFATLRYPEGQEWTPWLWYDWIHCLILVREAEEKLGDAADN